MEFDHHHRGTAELHNDASPTIDAVHPFTTGDSASTRQVGAAPQLHNTHEQQQQQQQQQRQNAQRFHFHRQGHEEVAGDESHRSVGDASGTYSHDQLQINLRAISQSHQQRHPSPTGGGASTGGNGGQSPPSAALVTSRARNTSASSPSAQQFTPQAAPHEGLAATAFSASAAARIHNLGDSTSSDLNRHFSRPTVDHHASAATATGSQIISVLPTQHPAPPLRHALGIPHPTMHLSTTRAATDR